MPPTALMLTPSQPLFRRLQALVSVLLPNQCALCAQTQDHIVCRDCQHDYLSHQQSRCRQCAIDLPDKDDGAVCGACLQQTPSFDYSVAVCDYAAPLDQLVLSLKFAHSLPLAAYFATHMRDVIVQADQRSLPDLLLPVPLGPARLATRGFNQAQEIARPLAQLLGVPLHAHVLQRQRETAQQSSLHPDERQKNMRKAFAVNPQHSLMIVDRHIGVVDDVMTTGTTLGEIAKVLKKHGAKTVTNYVFARTPLPRQ